MFIHFMKNHLFLQDMNHGSRSEGNELAQPKGAGAMSQTGRKWLFMRENHG